MPCVRCVFPDMEITTALLAVRMQGRSRDIRNRAYAPGHRFSVQVSASGPFPF